MHAQHEHHGHDPHECWKMIQAHVQVLPVSNMLKGLLSSQRPLSDQHADGDASIPALLEIMQQCTLLLQSYR